MSWQFACIAQFENRLRWKNDAIFFHRVVGCGPVVEFTMQACDKQQGNVKVQVWSSVGQACHLVCGSSRFLLQSDQMIHVMDSWRNCLPLWANQANCLQHAPALAGATCGGPGDRVGPSCEELNASYEVPGLVCAHACPGTARSRTLNLFCWQACETRETGMKPE